MVQSRDYDVLPPPGLPPPGLALPPAQKPGKMAMLWTRAKENPAVFGFLGLTVGALGLGLRALAHNDKGMSQRMMRARVFFQFCTVTALIGGVYYRAYQGATPDAFDAMILGGGMKVVVPEAAVRAGGATPPPSQMR